MAISDENRQIGKKLASALAGGAKPQVNRYWDEADNAFVDLMACENQPNEGVTSYGTIGLSDHPLVQDDREFPVRLELVGAAASGYEIFPNILTTAAFYVINEKWFCCPGAILRNVVDMYEPSLAMKHLMFVSPFLWEDELRKTDFGAKSVAWLLAVPISESEREFAEQNSPEALEDLFEQHQIDVFDLSRKSIL